MLRLVTTMPLTITPLVFINQSMGRIMVTVLQRQRRCIWQLECRSGGWGIGQHPYEQDSKLNFTISRILISPDDSNKIIASTRKGILYTENAGNTWAMATKSDDSDLDDEFHDIEFKPGDSNVAYAGAEGGFWKSVDGGISWTESALPNSAGANRTAIAVAESEPSWVYLISSAGNGGLHNLYKTKTLEIVGA